MKKLFLFVLVFCLVLGFVACTKPVDKNATEPTGTVPTDPAITAPDPNAIYRDVTMVQASNTTTEKIPGYAINLDDPVADGYAGTIYQYRVNWGERDDPGNRGDSNTYRVEKYDGENKLWTMLIKQFSYTGLTVLSDGVMVYGEGGMLRKDNCLVKFGTDGKFLWEHTLENPEIVTIKAVVENADGSYAVFSVGWTGDKQCLCLNQISSDGRNILFKTNTIGENQFGCVARVGDGYWVRIGQEEFTVVRLDYQGNIVDSISYGEENTNYNIRGMMEYNGKVYMSVNSSPKIVEKSQDNKNSQELFDVLHLSKDLLEEAQKKTEDGKIDVTLAYDITDRIKNHYTAMLLVCDAKSGVPLEFYSVKESFGGKLVVNEDGTLLWNVKNTLKAKFTPYLDSSLWNADCQLYRCVLDATGKPISVKKTDEIMDWYYDWGYT